MCHHLQLIHYTLHNPFLVRYWQFNYIMDFRIILIAFLDLIIITKNTVKSLADIFDQRVEGCVIRKIFERRSRIVFCMLRIKIRYDINNYVAVFVLSNTQNKDPRFAFSRIVSQSSRFLLVARSSNINWLAAYGLIVRI